MPSERLHDQLTKKEPIIIKWPGKHNPRVGWKFKDVLLKKGVLVTPTDKRNIYIPRPSPESQANSVLIINMESKSRQVVTWDTSKAYMLEGGVCITPHNNESVRTWLLTFRDIEESRDKEDRGAEGGRSAEDV
ncbi:hypothetical protein F66182_8649 [Fusarium sp. NRRL 66182]|nr:hypothetical protein F66182_8649 [Fusarium sp. NRRL 66182]